MYERKYALENVLKRSVEIVINRHDEPEFLEAAREMELDAQLITDMEDQPSSMRYKVFYIKPMDMFWLGLKFGQAKINKDPVF